jgi:hypothetical protein
MLAASTIALAAAFALFMRSQSADSENATKTALDRAVAAQSNPPAAPHAVSPTAPAAAPGNAEGVVTPEALASAPARERGASAHVTGATKASAPTAAVAGNANPSTASSAAPSNAVVLDEDSEPAQAVAATEPKPKVEPAPEPELKPAEGNSGSVPLTPSAGAVSTALASVRGSAQACLAGQSDPVSAVVTFAPDGHVLRVSAGGPSGACIQAALSKARIQPFARDSFSATTTIRPP